jgi:hypothetical protein
MEYGPTFPLKDWLTLEQAARKLSAVIQEELTEADVLRFALQKHLTLSVYFPNLTKAKYGEIVQYPRSELDASLAEGNLPADLNWELLSPEDAASLPDLPKEGEGEHVLVIRTLKIDAEHYAIFPGKVTTIGGVWDLPMIGGEQLDIEERYQQLTNGPAVTLVALEGAIVRGKNNELCQLQEQLNVQEYSSFWDKEHRKLKQYIIDGDIAKEEGERLVNLHKEQRKQILKKIIALPVSESYRPAGRLPKASLLVVRSEALRQFVQLVKNSKVNGDDDTTGSSEHSLQTSSCQPAPAVKIIRHFNVKLDPDENDKWWKDKMREAKRNGLAECRVGEGLKGPGGSLWRPDLIAGWLVDRYEKDSQGLNPKAAAAALRKFPGCEEAADNFFSDW